MRKVVIFVCIYLVINSLILVLAKLFSKMQLVNEQRPVLMLVSGLLSVIFTWYIVTESNNNLEKELDRIDSEEDKERITRLINKGQLGCLVSLAIVVVFTAASVISGYYAVAVLILSLGYLAAIYLMRNNMRVYNDKIKKILKKQRVDDEIREESQEAETQATDSPYCSQLDGMKTGAVSEDYSEDKVFDSNGTIKISEQVFCELKSTIIAMLRLVKSVCSNSEYLQTMRRMSNTDGRACDYWFNIKSQLVKDVVRCYQEMGYPPTAGFDTPQGQCLYVFVVLLADEDEAYDYSYQDLHDDQQFDTIKNQMVRNRNLIIKKFIGTNTKTVQLSDIDDLNLTVLFGVFNTEVEENYRLIIFRFCQLVAKAAGKISPQPAKWLKTILHNEMMLMYDGEEDEEKPEWVKLAQENLRNAAVQKNSKSKVDTIHEAPVNENLAKLNELIGLRQAKSEIASLCNFIHMKQMRAEMDLKSPTISYHCVFSGNPGTGKTTVARILAGIYRDLGILNSGHLVETDRSGLVAEYVGQTAVKTNRIIDSALDGILFIDEAYTLANGDANDYGAEAIATLLKRMEDDRERLVVILAGYTDEIEAFINSNPGLRSRFNRYIHFDDYTAEELYEIFCVLSKKNEYELMPEAAHLLQKQLSAIVANKPKDFGNARYIRNLFEKVVEAQAGRLTTKSGLSKKDLTLITEEDLQRVNMPE